MNYSQLTPEQQHSILVDKLHFWEREHYILSLELTAAETDFESETNAALKEQKGQKVLDLQQRLHTLELSIQSLGKLNGI